MKDTKLFLIFIVALAVMASCDRGTAVNNSASSPNAPVASTPPASPAPVDEAALGADLYAANCMTCHRESGVGGKATVDGKTLKAENLTEEKFKRASDEKLTNYILDGVEDEGMPAFRNKLTDDQIRLIVAHVRSLQK